MHAACHTMAVHSPRLQPPACMPCEVDIKPALSFLPPLQACKTPVLCYRCTYAAGPA